MNAVSATVNRLGRAAGRAATMTTEAAGALGGAAVNGVVGGVTGVAAGVQRGIGSGSRSTPAAALTFGALGVAGLVEWPVLLTVGGATVLLRQLNQRPASQHPEPVPAPPNAASTTSGKTPRTNTRTKSADGPKPSARRVRAGQ